MHPRSQTTELLLLVLCLVMFDIRVLEDTVYKRLLGAGFKLRYLSLFLCMQLIRFACLTRHIGLKQIAAFMCPSSVVHANSKQFNRQVQVRGTDQRGNKKKITYEPMHGLESPIQALMTAGYLHERSTLYLLQKVIQCS